MTLRVPAVLSLVLLLPGCLPQPVDTLPDRAAAPPSPPAAASAARADPQTAKLLARADADVAQAKKLIPGWDEADRSLAEAHLAAARGSDRRAQYLADEALARAGFALDAHYLALAHVEMQKAQTYTGLTDAQVDQLRLAELAIARSDGRKAFALLTALNHGLAQTTRRYVVAAGDSLWIISGREEVYGNPWLWPLIWQSNLEVIKDPNRLLVGQKLKIRPNPTIDEVVKAVEYAHEQAAGASRSVHIGVVQETR